MLRKNLSIALSLIGLFSLAMPRANAIEVSISPPRLEVEMNGKNRTQSININNLGKQPIEMRVYVRSWTTNEENKLQEIESNEQSLDQWIVFTPSRFTIQPGRSQTIRFAIRPKVQPKSGEHRAVFYFEQIPPESQNQAAVVTIARLGAIVYAYAGEIKRVGMLNSVNVNSKPNAVTAVFDISSSGNAHVRMRGQYAVWRAANYPGASATKPLPDVGNSQAKLPNDVLQVGTLELPAVLPATRRQLLLPIAKKLPPGNYILDLNGELSGVSIDKGIPFTVPASAATTKPATKSVTATTK